MCRLVAPASPPGGGRPRGAHAPGRLSGPHVGGALVVAGGQQQAVDRKAHGHYDAAAGGLWERLCAWPLSATGAPPRTSHDLSLGACPPSGAAMPPFRWEMLNPPSVSLLPVALARTAGGPLFVFFIIV